MKLGRMDHVAIEVADLDARIERLCRTGGMRLLRRGTNKRSGGGERGAEHERSEERFLEHARHLTCGS
jgi:catechol 2,3-dioxygenase-like lactoylglutathione lyase family enzyme